LDDGAVRARLGRFAAEVEVCNLLVYARLERELAGRTSVADVPIGKLAFSELNLAMAEFGVSLLGADGLVAGSIWQDELLYARTYTVAGGASEIMRNVLAERALGMPREARG
jgi:alkylation response protein AidB-like acyl-CoA dehydrogenase